VDGPDGVDAPDWPLLRFANQREETVQMNAITIGLAIAKSVF
jgi:hypothetical protein